MEMMWLRAFFMAEYANLLIQLLILLVHFIAMEIFDWNITEQKMKKRWS